MRVTVAEIVSRLSGQCVGDASVVIDRIATLMCGVDSIREVIAFPKTASAQCPLTSAPSEVPERQLMFTAVFEFITLNTSTKRPTRAFCAKRNCFSARTSNTETVS